VWSKQRGPSLFIRHEDKVMEERTTAIDNANGDTLLDEDELFIKEVQCYEVMPLYVDPAMLFPILPPQPKKKVKRKKQKSKHHPRTPERRIISKLDLDATPRIRNSLTKKPADAEQLKHQSEYIQCDWSSLKLGQELGSAAWNSSLRERLYQNPALKSVPQFTAMDCLQRIQALELQTIIPPPDSELHQVVKSARFMETKGFDDTSDDSLPMQTLGRLYERMVQQQVDTTLERMEYQFLTADDLVSRMRSMETEAAMLHAKEKRIRRTGTTLGLVNSETNTKVGSMLGYWHNDDKGDTEGYWREDFGELLKNESDKTAFLTWHDMI